MLMALDLDLVTVSRIFESLVNRLQQGLQILPALSSDCLKR